VITAALPAASILAAETEEVEGWRLLIPAGYDILWSSVVLIVIGVVFYKLVLPKFQAVLDERTEKIEGGLAKAASAQEEAAAAKAEYEQQLQDARADFDRMFLEMMIEHHQGAITMSEQEQANGLNKDALALAGTIIGDQTEEIAKMKQMLADM